MFFKIISRCFLAFMILFFGVNISADELKDQSPDLINIKNDTHKFADSIKATPSAFMNLKYHAPDYANVALSPMTNIYREINTPYGKQVISDNWYWSVARPADKKGKTLPLWQDVYEEKLSKKPKGSFSLTPRTYNWADVAVLMAKTEDLAAKTGENLNKIMTKGASNLQTVLNDGVVSETEYDSLGSQDQLSVMRGEHREWEEPEMTSADYAARRNMDIITLQNKYNTDKNGAKMILTHQQFKQMGVVKEDRANLPTDVPENRPDWEMFNAAVDDYESTKNSPINDVSGMFKSEYEKESYEKTIESINAGIEKTNQMLEDSQAELASLKNNIQNLNDQIYQANNNIAALQQSKELLEKSIAEEKDKIGETQNEKNKLLDEINANIQAEQDRLARMQQQQASSMDGFSTMLEAVKLAGNISSMSRSMSASRHKKRERVYEDTTNYSNPTSYSSAQLDYEYKKAMADYKPKSSSKKTSSKKTSSSSKRPTKPKKPNNQVTTDFYSSGASQYGNKLPEYGKHYGTKDFGKATGITSNHR
jgi:uncharacterized coiled-coil protein SlyX